MIKLTSTKTEGGNSWDGAYSGDLSGTSLTLNGSSVSSSTPDTNNELSFAYAVGSTNLTDGDFEIGDELNVSVTGLTITVTKSGVDDPVKILDNEDVTWTQTKNDGWWAGDKTITIPATHAFSTISDFKDNGSIQASWTDISVTTGSDVEVPEYEIAFDKSKDIELGLVDASTWGNPNVTKAAQKNVPVTVAELDGKTYGDLKGAKFTLAGVDYSGYNLPDGITAANISTSIYIKWGTDASKWSSNGSPWTIGSLDSVSDTDPIAEIGYQININGDVGGINDMDIDDTIKLTLKSSGEEPGGETPTIPEGTKLVAEANQWSSGALQANVAATVPGITNWTTTAAEADEILGGKAITFKLPINGAISNGSTFDLSKISVSAFMQTNATPGMWISKDATKGEDGVYTMVIDNYAESLKATSGEVNIGVQISISETDAAGAESVDIYVGALTVEVAGGSTEEPGETTSKVLWEGTQDFGEWANSVEIANSKLGELNAGDKIVISFTPSEGAQLSLKYNDTNWPGLPDFGDAEWHCVDVTTSPYTYTLTANDITALGTFSLIVSGQKVVATKVELVSAGGSGTTTPGGDNPGGDNPGTPNIPSRPSTPSTSEPEETVKFEDGKNQTGAVVEAPKDAFEADVTFNAAPVAEETKDDKFTFELNFTDKDGNKVQPKSEVTVKIPVPAALSGKTVYVYHIEENGTYTEISCKIEDGMVVFSAKSFSKYVITSQKLNANGEPVAEQPGTSDPGTSNPGSTNEPNANTGVGGAAAVLGITAIAAGAMIVSKKRK